MLKEIKEEKHDTIKCNGKINFVALKDEELQAFDGTGKRNYDWGNSIGRFVHNVGHGAVKFIKGLF